MKIRSTPPAEVLAAIVALLLGCVPDLTPTRLVAALRNFEPDNDGRQSAAPPARMLSLKEAADALAVSVDTVRRAVKDGRLVGRKVGKLWRVPAAAVAALAEVGEGQ